MKRPLLTRDLLHKPSGQRKSKTNFSMTLKKDRSYPDPSLTLASLCLEHYIMLQCMIVSLVFPQPKSRSLL